MKFSTAALAAVALGSVALAAPTEVRAAGVPAVSGTINCNTLTHVCKVNCGFGLGGECAIIGVWDSFWYDLETLVGIDVDCTANGCIFSCPPGETASANCVLQATFATFDSVWGIGESIIIDSIGDIQDSLLSGVGITKLPTLPAGYPGLPAGSPKLPGNLPLVNIIDLVDTVANDAANFLESFGL